MRTYLLHLALLHCIWPNLGPTGQQNFGIFGKKSYCCGVENTHCQRCQYTQLSDWLCQHLSGWLALKGRLCLLCHSSSLAWGRHCRWGGPAGCLCVVLMVSCLWLKHTQHTQQPLCHSCKAKHSVDVHFLESEQIGTLSCTLSQKCTNRSTAIKCTICTPFRKTLK